MSYCVNFNRVDIEALTANNDCFAHIKVKLRKIHLFLKIYQLKDNKLKDDPTRIIKPNKDIDGDIHNIYSDLYIPNLIAKIEYEASKYANFKIKLLTLDKALNSYIEIFKITIVNEIKTNQFYKNWNSIEVEITSKTIREFLKNLFEKWENYKATIVK